MKEALRNSLEGLRRAARSCQDCPLWEHATQTVFGAGNPRAEVMLVGEQPGDQEDVQGLPFVGPAGQLLVRALQKAGVDRDQVYVTNAVFATLHPSAILRVRGGEEREEALDQLAQDLALIKRVLAQQKQTA
jgi:uracil-DNA glycosylase family 4